MRTAHLFKATQDTARLEVAIHIFKQTNTRWNVTDKNDDSYHEISMKEPNRSISKVCISVGINGKPQLSRKAM